MLFLQNIIKLKFEKGNIFAKKSIGYLGPVDERHKNRYFGLI